MCFRLSHQPLVDMWQSLRCHLPHLTTSSHTVISQTPEALFFTMCNHANENIVAPSRNQCWLDTDVVPKYRAQGHALSYQDSPTVRIPFMTTAPI